MKKLLNYFLMLLVLLSMTACTMELEKSNQNNDMTLNFDLRSASRNLAGAQLKVCLTYNSSLIDMKQKEIIESGTPNEDQVLAGSVVKLNFVDLPLEADIVVSATIEQNGKLLYVGSTTKKISNKENKVELTLVAQEYPIKANVKTTVSTKDLVNSTIFVKVGNVLKTSKPIIYGDGDSTTTISTDPFETNAGDILTVTIENNFENNKIVIFEGTHEVTKSDSEIIMTLNQLNSRILLYPTSLITDYTNYQGAKFEVTVEHENPRSINIGTLPDPTAPQKPTTPVPALDTIYVDLGFRKLNEPINISAHVFLEMPDNPTEIVNFYDYKGPYTPQVSNNKLNGMYVNTGLFIYENRREAYRVYQDEQIGTQNSIASGFIDFAFSNKGDLYLLNRSESSSEIIIQRHGMVNTTEKLTIEDPINKFPTYNAISHSNNKLYLGGVEKGDITDTPILVYCNDDGTQLKDVSDSLSSLNITNISNLVVNGNNIYIASTISNADNPDDINFKIFKGTISANNEITFATTPLVDSSTLTSQFGSSEFAISDMEIVDNKLYAIIIDISHGPEVDGFYQNNSRGAILTIGNDNQIELIGLTNNKKSDAPASKENVYMLKDTMLPDDGSKQIDTLLIGPRKFIAIKPKKLVIADAGAVYSVNPDGTVLGASQLRKRIVTVDLTDYTSSSIRLEPSFFDGALGSGGYSHQVSLY